MAKKLKLKFKFYDYNSSNSKELCVYDSKDLRYNTNVSNLKKED